MRSPVFHIIAIAFLFTACNKTTLPDIPDSNDPVYYLRGEVSGNAFDINVGVSDATIEYGISDMNGIESYYGQITSESEDFDLRLDILRSELPNAGNSNSVMPAQPELMVHKPGAVQFRFGSCYQQADNLLIMNEEMQFELKNMVEFSEFGLYHITLKFTDYNLKTFDVPIHYGFEPQLLNPAFISNGTDSVCQLFPVVESAGNEWYVNDVLVSTDGYCAVAMEDGIHSVKRVAIDAQGNRAEKLTLIRFSQGKYLWQLEYVYSNPELESNYAKAVISFKKNGIWHKSSIVPSNAGSVLNITDAVVLSTGMTAADLLNHFGIAFDVDVMDESHEHSLSLGGVSGRMAVGLH